MARFQVNALDRHGRPVSWDIEAASLLEARTLLKGRDDVVVTSIDELPEAPPRPAPPPGDWTQSPLLQRPVRTLALAIFLGLVAYTVFSMILSLIFGGAVWLGTR